MKPGLARGFYLAVDTSTEACSVALYLNGEIRERFEVVHKEHTAKLLPMAQALMTESGRSFSQLDGIACGIGPGSFAGVRIGVGVVKGLALASDLPVVGVSSLAMLAQRVLRLEQAVQVIPVIDARMNEVYAGAYRRGQDGRASSLRPDQVCAAALTPKLPSGEWVGVGSGWAVYEPALRAALGVQPAYIDAAALPHAEDALWLALPEFAAGHGQTADTLVPAYLRDRVALTLSEQESARR